jgi:hypothetical protein
MVNVANGAHRALVEGTAADVGQRWCASWQANLVREGRAPEAGCPATLAQARALVAASLTPALVTRRMPRLTDDELVAAMRTTYDEAKRAWLNSTKRRSRSNGDA